MKISVIMPMYNATKTVLYSVDSIVAQTYTDFEVLIVDDCSTDESVRICEEHYKDEPRVKVIRQEKNAGPAAARNRGMELAQGEYITFLDSDDGMLPDTLEKFADAAKKTDADVVHTVGKLIPGVNPTPDDIMSVPREKLMNNVADTDAPDTMTILPDDIGARIDGFLAGKYKGNVWGKMFKTKFLRDNALTFAHLKMSEDTIFSLECLLRAGTYVQIPESLIIYRMVGDSLSRGKKTPAFFAKILDATLGGNVVLQEKLSAIPYVKEHPENIKTILIRVAEAMEGVYIRPAYRIVGREAIESDDGINEVWSRYFGGNAFLMKKTFYDAHDSYPPVPDYFSEVEFGEMFEDKLKSQNKQEG
ncbi:MAG: glycosyltransferase [Lachnospiraceae bacterium]|nr:glycosyltransferase [Lachnospiraceae bacterium]